MITKRSRRKRRHAVHGHIRSKLSGTAELPRLSVWRSARNVSAQIIDDSTGRTLVSASTLEKASRERIPPSGNVAAARAVGELVAERALENKITQVVFDRGGFLYHGGIKALAEAARTKGLKF
jgi:large subunit ribosomal protein L18